MSTAAPALKRPDGSNVRVLVVDDESNLTELLSMALRYEGWDIKTAATGNSAVKTAKEFKPDAVVLDMMLPDFDGLEVLRRMRDEDPLWYGLVNMAVWLVIFVVLALVLARKTRERQ